jgi:hypothetical protein
MRRIALIYAVLALPCGAAAQDWVALPAEQPNVLFAVDLASIKRDGHRVTVQERLTYDNANQFDPASGKRIKEKRVLRVLDCKDKKQGMLSGSMLSDTGSLIEMLSFDQANLEMTPIPPGTLAEEELRLVCGWFGEAPPPKP